MSLEPNFFLLQRHLKFTSQNQWFVSSVLDAEKMADFCKICYSSTVAFYGIKRHELIEEDRDGFWGS
jgi:hypothetical protein